jgi:bacterioferritin (cytochrome b1)
VATTELNQLQIEMAVLKNELQHVLETVDTIVDYAQREQLVTKVAVIEERISELEDKIKVLSLPPSNFLGKAQIISFTVSGLFSILAVIITFLLKGCGV